jgi:predicted RNase H-like nuclease (RuvC/YqgF family)
MNDTHRIQELEKDVEKLITENERLDATVSAMMGMIEELHGRLVAAGLIATDGSALSSPEHLSHG